MFETVYDGRRTDGRTTDGRRLDGYPISSPCEPNGSGELKSNNKYLNIHISQYKQAENWATDTTQKVHKLTK